MSRHEAARSPWPRPATALRETLAEGYTAADFRRDLLAGAVVGIVALPLSMALAIASGVPPAHGLYTAIVAGGLIPLLGGSRVQVSGPTAAFVVILAPISHRFGVGGLVLATLMAGALLLAMGAMRLGRFIEFVPYPVTTGFTAGIAVVIATLQVKDLLGLRIDKLPADFFTQVGVLARPLDTFNPQAFGVGLACLAVVVLWPKSYTMPTAPLGGLAKARRWAAHVPGTIVALVGATVATVVLGLEVETIGSRFGGIPQTLPSFQLPEFSWATAKFLLFPTLTIALLGAIESLLCARVADNIIEDRHDPNQELMAQGVANFVAPFFGGIPATGTIARTVTNVKSGATSPIAGIVHALTLLVVVLVAAPLAAGIPLAALAGLTFALVMAGWIVRRGRAALGAPHAGLRWYLAAVLCLVLALAAAGAIGVLPEQRAALRLLHLHLNPSSQ